MKATEFIFNTLGLDLNCRDDNFIIEVCTEDLHSILKDFNFKSSLSVDAKEIFITSTVNDVSNFDSSLVKDLMDNELHLDGKTFIALTKFLIQENAVIDYGTVNELSKHVILHGKKTDLNDNLISFKNQIASDVIFRDRTVKSAHFDFYIEKDTINHLSPDYLASISGCKRENIEINIKDRFDSKTESIVDLTLTLDYPVYKACRDL